MWLMHYLKNIWLFPQKHIVVALRSRRNRDIFLPQGCCLYGNHNTTGSQTCWRLTFQSWTGTGWVLTKEHKQMGRRSPTPTTVISLSLHTAFRHWHASQRRPHQDKPCARDGRMDARQEVTSFCTRESQLASSACRCIPESSYSHLSHKLTA